MSESSKFVDLYIRVLIYFQNFLPGKKRDSNNKHYLTRVTSITYVFSKWRTVTLVALCLSQEVHPLFFAFDKKDDSLRLSTTPIVKSNATM